MFELLSQPSVIDLPSDTAVIELTAPPLSTMVAYVSDDLYLVDEVPDFLVDGAGDFLVAADSGTTRTGIIDLKD